MCWGTCVGVLKERNKEIHSSGINRAVFGVPVRGSPGGSRPGIRTGLVGFMGYGALWGSESTVLIFEPACANARWTLTRHFLSVCDWTKILTRQKIISQEVSLLE